MDQGATSGDDGTLCFRCSFLWNSCEDLPRKLSWRLLQRQTIFSYLNDLSCSYLDDLASLGPPQPHPKYWNHPKSCFTIQVWEFKVTCPGCLDCGWQRAPAGWGGRDSIAKGRLLQAQPGEVLTLEEWKDEGKANFNMEPGAMSAMCLVWSFEHHTQSDLYGFLSLWRVYGYLSTNSADALLFLWPSSDLVIVNLKISWPSSASTQGEVVEYLKTASRCEWEERKFETSVMNEAQISWAFCAHQLINPHKWSRLWKNLPKTLPFFSGGNEGSRTGRTLETLRWGSGSWKCETGKMYKRVPYPYLIFTLFFFVDRSTEWGHLTNYSWEFGGIWTWCEFWWNVDFPKFDLL